MKTVTSILASLPAGIVTKRNVIAFGIAIVLLSVYCAGGAVRGRKDAIAALTVQQRVVHDTLIWFKDRVRTDTLRLVPVRKAASASLAKHDSVATYVTVVSDSSLSIDGRPPEIEIRAADVIPDIQTCADALRQYVAADSAWAQSFHDAIGRSDFEAKRADLAELMLRKSHSRFGIRTGFTAGVALTAILVKVLR